MHISPMWDLFHYVHHSFNPSLATCSESFHPLDLALLAIGTMLVSQSNEGHGSLIERETARETQRERERERERERPRERRERERGREGEREREREERERG